MIYVPTMTSKLRGKQQQINLDYILYSPNKKIQYVYLGSKITIWDNHTFYLFKRMHDPQKAFNHYLWLINYIKQNYVDGITLITPDVDWLDENDALLIEKQWSNNCKQYPQLYIPNTWRTNTDNLNIVGNALRKETVYKKINTNWVHCLAHKRPELKGKTKLLTYDSVKEIV